MRRKRLLLYVLLALAVPLPAFALGLAGPGSGSSSLDAQASLDSCGLFESQIVCKINASYNEVAGATSYTGSVTAPNGAVSDYGDVGAGGTSFWVPYVGNGTYTVEIQAWGTPPSKDSKPPLVTSDKAGTGNTGEGDGSVQGGSDEGATGATGADGTTGSTGDTGVTGSTGTSGDTGVTGPGDVPPEPCPPPPPPPPPPAPEPDPGNPTGPTGPSTGTGATISGSTTGLAGLEAEGEVPQPDECTDPSAPTDGCCVPAG
jgi:collagen type VII alpha